MSGPLGGRDSLGDSTRTLVMFDEDGDLADDEEGGWDQERAHMPAAVRAPGRSRRSRSGGGDGGGEGDANVSTSARSAKSAKSAEASEVDGIGSDGRDASTFPVPFISLGGDVAGSSRRQQTRMA